MSFEERLCDVLSTIADKVGLSKDKVDDLRTLGQVHESNKRKYDDFMDGSADDNKVHTDDEPTHEKKRGCKEEPSMESTGTTTSTSITLSSTNVEKMYDIRGHAIPELQV
jgi:hypothetical protein